MLLLSVSHMCDNSNLSFYVYKDKLNLFYTIIYILCIKTKIHADITYIYVYIL